MGFFNALKRLLPHASHAVASEESRQRIRAAWGLDDDETDTAGRGDQHALPSTTTTAQTLPFSTVPGGKNGCGGFSTNCPVRSRNGTT